MLRPDTFALTALLAALTAIGPLTTDMYLPSLPDIARILHVAPAQAQLTISSYLIGFAVGQLIYGPLSDRYGRKPVLLAANLVFLLASASCALAPTNTVLIVTRFLQALGGCGGIVLARAIVRDLYHGARAGRELSLIGSVMGIAPVIAPLVGGVLHAAFGWHSSFVLLAVVGGVLFVLVWRLLPETMEPGLRSPMSLRALARSFRTFMTDGSFIAHMGIAMLSYAGLFAWISSASFILQDLQHIRPLVFGVVFAMGSVGYTIGAAIAARIVGRLGLDRTIGIGASALAAGGLLVAAGAALDLHSPFAIVLPMNLYLIGLGLVLGQSMAGAMSPYRRNAGAASSLLGFAQQAGAAVSGAIVGHMLGDDAWPLAGAVSILGCLAFILWATTRQVRAKADAH